MRDDVNDDLLGLVMAVAHGWPNDTAPAYVREVYIEALRIEAQALTEKYAGRVAILRARNAAEMLHEIKLYELHSVDLPLTCTSATGTFRLQGSTTPPPTSAGMDASEKVSDGDGDGD